ncbi:accessory gene regulator B family protein [Chengkuizengella axinellae]|uniref:Accessory gene regulator B family protein n=1 Tax=Chengkuizengella axinellae TaxID=3064388 RepID=A0ABT9IYD8_9BACL|nr:accessory gene regulator B family protein [Chengkuizengella sp. 2205SS18-9]MDP5274375.1 accessory gene regulator B family protein [Chengkuizengella sp. 2205SS18-9]
MIELISLRIARVIHTANVEETEDVETLQYYLSIYLTSVLIVFFTLGIGYITGTFYLTLLGLFSFWLLRKVSGGLHLTSLTGCVFFSTLLLSSLPHLSLGKIILELNIISLIIVILFSPNFHTISISNKRKKTYKFIAIIIVFVSMLLNIEVITKAIFIQAVTLLSFRREGFE